VKLLATTKWAFERLLSTMHEREPTFAEAVAKVLEEGGDVETEAAYAFPNPDGEPYFTVLDTTGDDSELRGHYEDATEAARAFVAIERGEGYNRS